MDPGTKDHTNIDRRKKNLDPEIKFDSVILLTVKL